MDRMLEVVPEYVNLLSPPALHNPTPPPPQLFALGHVSDNYRRDIHDKSGIFMGSWDEVEKVKQFHKSS